MCTDVILDSILSFLFAKDVIRTRIFLADRLIDEIQHPVIDGMFLNELPSGYD